MSVRILVIEDDIDIREAVTTGLRNEGMAVDAAPNLAEARGHLAVNQYNAIVADRMVPDGDSVGLVIDLRDREEALPVLFLTARDSVEDRVEGFENGGDDYLVKPFAMQELIVRVRSLCRRGTVSQPVVKAAGLTIDQARAEVRRDGVLLPLTPKELCLITQLASNAGTVLSRATLIEHCWDEDHDPMSNVVDAHMASLRRKLGADNPIQTIRGTGFLLDETNADS